MKSRKEVHIMQLFLSMIPRAVVTWSSDNTHQMLASVLIYEKIIENFEQNVFSLLPYFVTSYSHLFSQLLKYHTDYNTLWQGKISLICQFFLVRSGWFTGLFVKQ